MGLIFSDSEIMEYILIVIQHFKVLYIVALFLRHVNTTRKSLQNIEKISQFSFSNIFKTKQLTILISSKNLDYYV